MVTLNKWINLRGCRRNGSHWYSCDRRRGRGKWFESGGAHTCAVDGSASASAGFCGTSAAARNARRRHSGGRHAPQAQRRRESNSHDRSRNASSRCIWRSCQDWRSTDLVFRSTWNSGRLVSLFSSFSSSQFFKNSINLFFFVISVCNYIFILLPLFMYLGMIIKLL